MDARRTLLADSALALIGRDGIRALTHHRLDDEAGLARGSASYYCRRRVDLLRLALLRLYVLDAADLSAMAERCGPTPSGKVVQEALADLLSDWLTGATRVRSVARIELFMAASHEPELQPVLTEQLTSLRATALPLVARQDSRGGAALVAAFMLADGLMLGVLREGRAAPPREEIQALLSVLN